MLLLLCVLTGLHAQDLPLAGFKGLLATDASFTGAGSNDYAAFNKTVPSSEAATHLRLRQALAPTRNLRQLIVKASRTHKDYVCSLTDDQKDRYLDTSTRTWELDDDVLVELENDIQSVINCTRKGDSLRFSASKIITPASQLIIPWYLRLGSGKELTESSKSPPRATAPVVFTCPSNDTGIILVKDHGVALSDLSFTGCLFNNSGDQRAIIEVQGCEDDSTIDVKLHRVRIFDNVFVIGLAMNVVTPACTKLDMTDVVLENNTCKGVCLGVLASSNTFQTVIVKNNTRADENGVPPVFFLAEASSQTTARKLTAENNEGTIFQIDDGSIEVHQSTFRDNNVRAKNDTDGLGGCFLFVMSTARMNASVFVRNNFGSGGAMYSSNSRVDIVDCRFEGNAAENGGALQARDKSRVALQGVKMTNNTASLDGACIYVDESSNVEIEETDFANNSAERYGGVIYVHSSKLKLERSSFKGNTADVGGAIFLVRTFGYSLLRDYVTARQTADDAPLEGLREKDLTTFGYSLLRDDMTARQTEDDAPLEGPHEKDIIIRKCSFLRNSARTSAGAINFESSEAVIENGFFRRGHAKYGGFIVSTKSVLTLSDVEFRSGSSRFHGGGLEITESVVTVQNVSIQDCQANKSGGGIFLYRSLAVGHNCTLKANRGRKGGAIRSIQGSLSLVACQLTENSASDSGGGICTEEDGEVNLTDCQFVKNSATLGGALSMKDNMTGSIEDSFFESSVAKDSGGALHVDNSTQSLRNTTFIGNTAQLGGSINVATLSLLKINGTRCEGSFAHSGGCLRCSNSRVDAENFQMVYNKADKGGAIFSDFKSDVHLKNGFLERNAVNISGGGLYLVESNLNGTQLNVRYNWANEEGGGFYASKNGTINLTDSNISKNEAPKRGGAWTMYNSSGTFERLVIDYHSADEGGAVYLVRTVAEFRNVEWSNNSASKGGTLSIGLASEIALTDTSFNGTSSSPSEGGCIFVDGDSKLNLSRVHISNAVARSNGGALSARGANLTAVDFNVSDSKTYNDGGAIFMDAKAKLLCDRCRFVKNEAERRGGGVAVESNRTEAIVVAQFRRSAFFNNEAVFGGGLHFIEADPRAQCSSTDCISIALQSVVFEGNIARKSGGAIFSSALDVLRVECGNGSAPEAGALTTFPEETLNEMEVMNKEWSMCPDWIGNTAGRYGPAIATNALRVEVKIIYENETTVSAKTNSHAIHNHKSGMPLPTIQLKAFDARDQAPAMAYSGEELVAAISSTGFIDAALSLTMDKDNLEFKGITSFVKPRKYKLEIKFDHRTIDPVEMDVSIRGCVIGEVEEADGLFCRECSAVSYNFEPPGRTTHCEPCPENANCTTHVIQPIKGYWHRDPCSKDIQRCLNKEACSDDDRNEKLENVGKNLISCEFESKTVEEYQTALCKEGHKGPLCGSCTSGYGKSLSQLCTKCSGFTTIGMVIISAVIIFVLAALTVRSHKDSLPPMASHPHTTNDQDTQGQDTTQSDGQGQRPESSSDSYPLNRSPNGQLVTRNPEAEMHKWKVIEILKILVNFLQVTSTAVRINVDWQQALVYLYTYAELISGMPSKAVNRTIDCLVPENGHISRSIVRIWADLSVPFTIISGFIVFWIIRSIQRKQGHPYLLHQSVLSTMAVFYISYISITRTLFNVFNCIKVRTSEDVSTRYWAMDMSQTCYEGSHLMLVVVMGALLPILVIVLPSLVAVCISRNVDREDYKKGWIYITVGFMYRSYRSNSLFWESIIMVRKALLISVIVFSYPLGGHLQAILAVCVLLLALYFHTLIGPYRKEFNDLNKIEGLSLLISCFAMISSLVFSDNRVSFTGRVTITVIIITLIVGFVIGLALYSVAPGGEYCRAQLESENVEYNRECHASRAILIYGALKIEGVLKSIWNWIRNKIEPVDEPTPV